MVAEEIVFLSFTVLLTAEIASHYQLWKVVSEIKSALQIVTREHVKNHGGQDIRL